MFLFIFFGICICLGIFFLFNFENPIFEKWESILLAGVLLIVFGCAGIGAALYNLAA